MPTKNKILALSIAMACAPVTVFATNGMNLEGYGPIATAMGGASMAYDNGTAAMMNNPATLGLMEDGRRLDLALGVLAPDVKASYGTFSWSSDATSFMMPAIGWVGKDDGKAFGFGVFAQGGMGTEFNPTSTQPTPGSAFVVTPTSTNPMGGNLSNTSTIASTVMGWEEMSEVGVMRIMLPFAMNMGGDTFTVGASLDYVKANLDIKMVMPGGMMQDMMPGLGGTEQAGSITGSFVTTMAGMMGAGPGKLQALYGGQFDFADSSPYTGQTTGGGLAVKLGFTMHMGDSLTIGGTFHNKTAIADLEGNGTLNMAIAADPGTGSTDMVVPMSGKLSVKDFQWPTTIAVGVAFQPNDMFMVTADVKQLKWSDVMKDFKMGFTPDATQSNAMAQNMVTGGATQMDATLFQNWDDQTVIQVGVAFNVSEQLTLRAGLNRSSNPVPDANLNYLFPATVENHMTLGAGFEISDNSEVNFSMTSADKADNTSGMGLGVTHSQTNWQLMYSMKY